MREILETIKGRYAVFDSPYVDEDSHYIITKIDDVGEKIERIKKVVLVDMFVSSDGIIVVRSDQDKVKELKEIIKTYEKSNPSLSFLRS